MMQGKSAVGAEGVEPLIALMGGLMYGQACSPMPCPPDGGWPESNRLEGILMAGDFAGAGYPISSASNNAP